MMDKKENTTCTASALLARLQELIELHGDLPVWVRDADTDWPLRPGLRYNENGDYDADAGGHIEITSAYHSEPYGMVK